MIKNHPLNNGIPVSVSLGPALERENFQPKPPQDKKRLFTISVIAIAIAICVSFIAKVLIYLIDLFTNISFYGKFSIEPASPANNSYGIYVILVPVIGGLIVGLMARYGSKAIRGHGIPEAMEQILVNQSKIKPSITYLKPLSAAISIGTGGPFGAEGPIIATGGALGSTIGQLLKITHNERKILLTAGATAGMSAIFGSPIAAVFLAIELLLFEFSTRSLIPVALACITGAAGHHLLFESGPVFPVLKEIAPSSNVAIACYSVMGLIIGVLSVLVTKAVYFIEDSFEKIPVHWAWWPAIGGIAVGIVGYFAPRTLGVGYNNITDLLSGSLAVQVVLNLCLLKFISWAVSLGSGTSGGTLAPLLTIGGATGALLGNLTMLVFPEAGVTMSLAALVGMSAMFAGAARAYLTSIVFALETTGQSNALLPLLATCTGSYFISWLAMSNTIMTEKIARRGVKTPSSYLPDVLEKYTVEQVLSEDGIILSEENSLQEIKEWLQKEPDERTNYFIVTGNNGEYKGILARQDLLGEHHDDKTQLSDLVKDRKVYTGMHAALRSAVETMAHEDLDVLPVIDEDSRQLAGLLTYADIISVYKHGMEEDEKKQTQLSIKRGGLKLLLRGQKLTWPRNRKK